jgi:hypothetical protein
MSLENVPAPGNGNLPGGGFIRQFGVELDFSGIGAPLAEGPGQIPFGADLMVRGNPSEVPAPPQATNLTHYSVTTQQGTVVDNKSDTVIDSRAETDLQDD